MNPTHPNAQEPTAEEIRARCLEIQATWDEREEARRRGIRLDGRYDEVYEIPRNVKSHK